jgi:hypothetical protein
MAVLVRAHGLVDDYGGPPLHDANGSDVVDLGQCWLIPGMIDMHNHLRLSHLLPHPAAPVQDAPVTYTLHAVNHLRTSLMSGVTTMRCNGDRRGKRIAVDGHHVRCEAWPERTQLIWLAQGFRRLPTSLLLDVSSSSWRAAAW